MRSKKLSFLVLVVLLLTPSLKGCVYMVPLAASYLPFLAVSASYVYYSVPGHLELKKDSDRPFSREYSGEKISSILVDDGIVYEGLDGSGVFKNIKITKAGTTKPRITEEAAQLARKYGTDGYFLMNYSSMSNLGEYGKSRIRIIKNSGEVIYDQTIRVVKKKRNAYYIDEIPSRENIKKMAVQGFLDDLMEQNN